MSPPNLREPTRDSPTEVFGHPRYFYEVKGRYGWKARYIKEVDALEQTTKFWQEIYDETGHLVEIHEKFPMDKGHRKVNNESHTQRGS